MVLFTGAMASVILKLGKLLNEEYKLQTGVRKKIQALTRDLESMHAALRKVAEVPTNELGDEVKIWARDVRELSYSVEDILDTFLVRVDSRVRDEEPGPNKLKSAVKKVGKLFRKIKVRHKISAMVKAIYEQAEEVAERHHRYRADDIVDKPKPATASTVDPRLAAMFREVRHLVGIDRSKAELISMLSLFEQGNDDGSSNQKVKIVSVVGAGGLGKTTLAKAVYDSLKPHFGCGAFVPVGQNPDLKKVLRDILMDLDKNVYSNSNAEKLDERQLLNELREFLRYKRYLFVIDDIWEPESWEIIKLALLDDICGCKVIITTRKLDVAKEAGEVYRLEPLPDDVSKRLFYRRLFGGEDKCPNDHLDELSSQILKKCGGVPLAIITMASLLLNKTREQWIEVCSSPGFCQDRDGRHIDNTMHILSLSYYDLPSHLKTCLLYLSAFPEDSLIDKDTLIWMWISEGFVEKKSGCGSFEVGEEYFDDLVSSSLIQGVDSEVYGIMDGCHVHDMVLDLIVSMSREENFISADGRHTRRLALQNRELDLTVDVDVNLPQVRSFIVWRCAITNAKWALHPRLKLIRVLALENCTAREGCHSLKHIGNLQHLRYLGIRDLWLEELSDEIGTLNFLQILDLDDTGILELPCSVGMLTQLVCLRAQQMRAPDGVIGRLTSLEELQTRGPCDNDESWRQFVKDLGNLCELRVLTVDNNTRRNMDARMQRDLMQSLGNLKKMQHLTLGDSIDDVNMNAWDAAVPSRHLRRLFLQNMDFPMLPSWINSAHLPSLTHLEICVPVIDEQGVKALGGLPQLCYLSLRTTSTLQFVANEADGCFHKLRSWVSPYSMVQFVANEADGCFHKLRSWVSPYSMVQFVASEDSGALFGTSRRKKDNCSRGVVPVPAVVGMTNLEELVFSVDVKVNRPWICGEDVGLEYLPLIRKVKAYFLRYGASTHAVEREEAALRHAVEVHPNHPALQIVK